MALVMTEVASNRRVLVERERQEHIRSGLQGASEPINHNSSRIAEFVDEVGAAAVNAIAHESTAIQGPLPYGATIIPYGIWSQFCKDADAPAIPDSTEAIDEAIDTFWPGSYSFPRVQYGRSVREDVKMEARDILRRMLMGLAPNKEASDGWTRALRSLQGDRLTPEQWRQYAALHHRQQAAGGRYTLDEISYVSMSNFNFNEQFGVFQELTGRHKSFIFAEPAGESFASVPARIRIPKVPYRGVSEKLLFTAAFMSLFDEQDYWLRNDAVTQATADVIAKHTTRAVGYDAPPLADSFVGGVREADEQTMPSALVLLTSSMVRGYGPDDGDLLVGRLIRDDVPDELALRIREGPVASAALYGVFIPDLVDSKSDGHLAISSRGIDTLQALQEISERLAAERLEIYHNAEKAYEVTYAEWERTGCVGEPPRPPRELVRTGQACPYAGLNRSGSMPEPGAITQRSLALRAVYDCMDLHTARGQSTEGLERRRPHFGKIIDRLLMA